MKLTQLEQIKLDNLLADIIERKVGLEPEDAKQCVIEYRRTGRLDEYIKLDLDRLVQFVREDYAQL